MCFQELDTSDHCTVPHEVWAVTNRCQDCLNPIQETPIIVDPSLLTKWNIRPLSITNVGSITEKILRRSLEDFDINVFVDDYGSGNITYEDAGIGVMQEFIDITWDRQVRLADRYTQHAPTEEMRHALSNIAPSCKSRDIGLTEIKCMAIPLIIQSICPKIHLELHRMFPGANENNIGTHLMSVPGETLPWISLIHQIHLANKLGGIIRYLYHATHKAPPMCFDSPKRASHYIGRACFIKQERDMGIPSFTMMTSYKDSDILNHIIPLVSCYARKIKTRELTDLAHQISTSHVVDEATKILLTCEIIYIHTLDIQSEDVRGPILANIRHMKNGLFWLPDTDMSNGSSTAYESLDDYINEENNQSLKTLKRRFTDIPWNESFEYILENEEEVKDRCNRYLDRFTCRIVLSDVATCINIIRGRRIEIIDEPNIEVIQDNIPIAGMVQIRPRIIDNPPRSVILPWEKTTMNEANFAPIVRDFVYNKVILDQCHCYRPYGSGTSSMNELLECLNLISIHQQLPDFINTACLGEGYGGMLDCLSRLTHNSLFLFDTLPMNPEVETYPFLANDSLEQNNNVVLTQHMMEGYYDLQENVTLERYEQYEHLYNIITCDAEVGDYNTPGRISLILNVVRFYIRNRTVNGVSIFKLNICEELGLHYVVAELPGTTRHIILHRCKSSNIGGEIYLIAFGILNQDRPDYQNNYTLPSIPVYRSIERFRNDMYNSFTNVQMMKNRRIIMKSNGPLFNLRMHGYFSSKFCS